MFGLYADYDARLQGRNATRRKIANNTYLERREDGSIVVRLHATDVVTVYRDDTCMLNTGGWLTVTTKDRMNTYGPVSVHSVKGIWYVARWHAGRYETLGRYFDGIRISDTNVILNPLATDVVERADRERKATERAIRAYAKRCGDEMPMPSGGDCWLCMVFGSTDCLAEHLREDYVHGAVIVRALADAGYPQPMVILQMGSADMVARAVRRYLSKNLLTDRSVMR